MRWGAAFAAVTGLGVLVSCVGNDAAIVTVVPAPSADAGPAPPSVDPNGGDGGTPAPSTIDVTGLVRAFTPGGFMRVAGADVALRDANGDKPAVVTGSDGTFRVPGVRPPYSVLLTQNDSARAMFVEGLTRPDPYLDSNLVVPTTSSTPFPSTAITFAVSDPAVPVAELDGNYRFADDRIGETPFLSTFPPSSSGDLGGVTTLVGGRLSNGFSEARVESVLVRLAKSGGLPSAYTSFAHSTVTVPKMPVSVPAFAFKPISSTGRTTDSNFSAPPGLVISSKQLGVVVDGTFYKTIAAALALTGPIDTGLNYLTPVAPELECVLIASAASDISGSAPSSTAITKVSPNAAGLRIALKPPVSVNVPANAATNVPRRARIEYTPPENTDIALLTIRPVANGSLDPRVRVVTTSRNVELPVALAGNVDYELTLTTWGPGTPDEWADKVDRNLEPASSKSRFVTERVVRFRTAP